MKVTFLKRRGSKEFAAGVELKDMAASIANCVAEKSVLAVREVYHLVKAKRQADGQISTNWKDWNGGVALPRVCFAAEWRNYKGQREMVNYNGLVVIEVNLILRSAHRCIMRYDSDVTYQNNITKIDTDLTLRANLIVSAGILITGFNDKCARLQIIVFVAFTWCLDIGCILYQLVIIIASIDGVCQRIAILTGIGRNRLSEVVEHRNNARRRRPACAVGRVFIFTDHDRVLGDTRAEGGRNVVRVLRHAADGIETKEGVTDPVCGGQFTDR